jgi:hypothetical protein
LVPLPRPPLTVRPTVDGLAVILVWKYIALDHFLVVLIEPIDGSSSLEIDCAIGSIFSIRRLKDDLYA